MQIITNLSSGLSEDGSDEAMSSNMREDSIKLWRTRKLKVKMPTNSKKLITCHFINYELQNLYSLINLLHISCLPNTQVLYSLCTCCVGMRDFRLAGSLLSRLLREDQASTAGLYAALGRLYLMLGDVASAQVGQRLEMSSCLYKALMDKDYAQVGQRL